MPLRVPFIGGAERMSRLNFTNEVRERTANRRVANLAGVQRQMDSVTQSVEARAKANLNARRKTGEHSISTDRGEVDRFVIMKGRGSLALEVGHHHNRSGEFVEGAHILRNALRK